MGRPSRAGGSLKPFLHYALMVWFMVFALPIGALIVLTLSHGFSVAAARFFLVFLFIVLTPSLPTALLIWCLRTGRVLSTVFGSLLGTALQIATFAVTFVAVAILEGPFPAPSGDPLGDTLMWCLRLGWWAPLTALVAGGLMGHIRAAHYGDLG